MLLKKKKTHEFRLVEGVIQLIALKFNNTYSLLRDSKKSNVSLAIVDMRF